MLRKSLAFVFVFIFVFAAVLVEARNKQGSQFVGTKGDHFVINGKTLYFSGFNSYWFMTMASDPSTRVKVSDTLTHASKLGMNVARTWAFSDGGTNPLQKSPGSYNENMFKGLDFVVSEAGKHGIYLILSLVNNWDAFGGKKQYVEWAREQGHSNLKNDDEFFTNPIVRGFYKNHVKAVLTRVNSISGKAYKDDSTILSWELMNEPRCPSDLSGKPIQGWLSEMAAYVKSIDTKHLVNIGLEGFYGESMPERKQNNPSGLVFGTDFIANNRIPQVDFADTHIYADQWLPGSSNEATEKFVSKWVRSHIDDSRRIIGKPLLISEFGRSSKSPNFSVGSRDRYFDEIYGDVYNGGGCGGALFWQLMALGMDSWSDGYTIVFENTPSTAEVVSRQSRRISSLNGKMLP